MILNLFGKDESKDTQRNRDNNKNGDFSNFILQVFENNSESSEDIVDEERVPN